AAARIKRFQTLTAVKPDHPETRMLMAELHIAAEDFPAAAVALGDLAETDPTARTLTLMAAIERGQGADDSVVRGWLARALTASRGPQWICDSCGTAHADWAPICAECGSFDTLSWKTAPAGGGALPNSAEMLPLIVGRVKPPEDKDETPKPVTADLAVQDDAQPVDYDDITGEVIEVPQQAKAQN
uniref:tetratricopeptide repeat protein n=1 Tax=Actibacterium sp. TaxID=1872125 RepID=UPI00356692B3